ncbi:MAG TPA: amino acid permease [Steroidobacteraceae bacterium]|nr:amino acid permease [Steroidobacteraceae bacterium]
MNATDDSVSASSRLSKSLLARHLVMISIGGIIGGGVFVGSSGAIANIGPAVLLSYISAGIVVFGVITILARMAMDRPGLGSFTEYVRVALGDGAGFITGWLYWWFWVVVVAFEALVGAQTAQAWLPQFEVWQIGLGLMVILTAVNLASARSYGEFEFWFASIKVAAIVAFIVVAAGWLLGVGHSSPSPGLANLTAHRGFAPFGWAAILTGVTTVIFSMVGAEIVTVAAAESAESNKTLSRLAASVVLRILLFYVVSIALILCIVPWTEFKSGNSTFAIALERIGIPAAAQVMNIIVLTAVLSCLNSGVYVTARVLFAMADKGDAPRWLTAVNKRHVPARAILLGSSFGFIVMLMRDIAPAKLFDFLMNSSGALMMFTYAFVAIAHFRFPYTDPRRRSAGGAQLVAGGAALAMIAVMVAMAFMPSKQPEMWASLSCFAIIVAALLVKRAVQKTPAGSVVTPR